VFLLDDFVATGTTLIRGDEGTWKGRLQRFWNETRSVIPTHLQEDWVLVVHHYIGTDRARRNIEERHTRALEQCGPDGWFRTVEFSFGCLLPQDVAIDAERYPDFVELTKKYYDPSIETRHTGLGGDTVQLGFGGCGLPLVLEHNTPNNSVALLWAETAGDNGRPPMRPLFRRRQRHS
jgi:hypothetical protein